MLIPQFRTFMDSGFEKYVTYVRVWSEDVGPVGVRETLTWLIAIILSFIELKLIVMSILISFSFSACVLSSCDANIHYNTYVYNRSISGRKLKPEVIYFTCISSPTGLNACISSLKYHWFFVIAQPIGVKNVLLIQQYNGLNSSLDQSNFLTSFHNRSKLESVKLR